MAQAKRERSLTDQLRTVLRMAGADPRQWVAGTVAVSVLLAGLDTLGVAAMVPLTQLATGTAPDDGLLGAIADAFGTTDVTTLLPLVASFVALVFIGKSVGAIVFRWWLLGRTTRVSALSSAELARRYALAPYVDHRSRQMSEVYRNIIDTTIQSSSVLLGVVSMATDGLVLIAIVAVLAIASPVVTIFTVVIFGVLVFGIQLLLRRRQYRIGEEMAEAGLEAWQFLLPGLDGFREARLTSSGGVFVDGFRRARMRQAKASREMGIISDAPRYLLEIGFVLAVLGISAYLFATTTPAAAVTVLGVFAAASLRALPALNRVSANLATIRTGQAGLDILTRVVEELKEGGTHEERPRSDARFDGDIVLRDVCYRYPDAEQDVLTGVSLRIAENSTTAFVGSSGAGKSTILDLVLGLLEPTEGTIECGGRSILDDRAAWYSQLGVVPQDVFLLNASLTANIAFGVPTEQVDQAQVERVVAMSQLGQLVSELPHGLGTTVGERGVRLSGGQRQRIGLARALYRRPSVLLLDEATSALDNVTEHEIALTLGALQGSMTIVIVAHRLSTVRHADNLVFLKNGRIEAEGDFEELRDQSPDFARLVKLGELG